MNRKFPFQRGPQITSKKMQDLLPSFLDKLNRSYSVKPDRILDAWPEIVGPHIAPMAKAIRFSEGVLLVKVSNSTLLSLLNHSHRDELLLKLRRKFPKTLIKTLVFRLG